MLQYSYITQVRSSIWGGKRKERSSETTGGKNQNLPIKSKYRCQDYAMINPFSPIERTGFCFFAKKTHSFKIFTNGKDEDIEETSLKQRVSLK